MKYKKIEAGMKFNRMTILSRYSGGKNTRWNCICECGNKKIVTTCGLNSGNTKSCGCLARENTIKRSTKHGMHGTPIYHSWRAILMRTKNKKYHQYHLYGGRGISVVDDWLSFHGFYRDMKDSYKKGLSIDRINNNGNYCKENCRWITNKEQARNRRSNVFLEYKGDRKTLTEWAEKLGFSKGSVISRRLKRNWTLEEALTLRK